MVTRSQGPVGRRLVLLARGFQHPAHPVDRVVGHDDFAGDAPLAPPGAEFRRQDLVNVKHQKSDVADNLEKRQPACEFLRNRHRLNDGNVTTIATVVHSHFAEKKAARRRIVTDAAARSQSLSVSGISQSGFLVNARVLRSPKLAPAWLGLGIGAALIVAALGLGGQDFDRHARSQPALHWRDAVRP